MNVTPVPPDAVLIRLAREGAGISVAVAAMTAGMSKSRWVQIENGQETRQGKIRAAHAKPVTLARMAYAVGVPPERLESEGQRPEAAKILREIIRQAEAPPTQISAPPASIPDPSAPSAANDEDQAIEAILRGDGMSVPEMTPAINAAIDVHIPSIRAAVEQAARAEAKRRGVPVATVLREIPAGSAVFPDDEEYAGEWDRWRADGYLSGVRYTVHLMIWGIAMRRVQDEVRAQQAWDSAAG